MYLWQKNRPTDSFAELQVLRHEREQLFEENARLKSELEMKTAKIGEHEEALRAVSKQKDQLAGELKSLISQHASLEADIRMIRAENSDLKKQVSEFEARAAQRAKEHDDKLKQLNESRQSFEDEKKRVRREDEERIQMALLEQSRVWDTHETTVKACLRDICQKPEIGFLFYENTSLPADFDGSFKPDCLIEFLGQFVIFDAKHSRTDLDAYIKDAVKKTAEKVRGNERIYPTIFLVVPTEDIGKLKKTVFVESEVTFYIIPPPALEPLLANFRKVAAFAHLSELDPRDREQIVTLIANYDQHIAFQNAANILFARESKKLSESQHALNYEILAEINNRKQLMRPIKLKEAELKRIASAYQTQDQEIAALVAPKPHVGGIEIKTLEPLFSDES